MPAFSGLYDGIHGDGYAALALQSRPPMLRGIVRVLMQKRGLYGTAALAGGTVPATRKQVQTELPTLTVRGGYDYANRQDDAANTVDIVHAGGDVNVLEDADTVDQPSAEDFAAAFDTTLNNGYVQDGNLSPVTSPELGANP